MSSEEMQCNLVGLIRGVARPKCNAVGIYVGLQHYSTTEGEGLMHRNARAMPPWEATGLPLKGYLLIDLLSMSSAVECAFGLFGEIGRHKA